MTAICTQLSAGLGELFQCEQKGEYVRIRTPFLYPDGDVIDVFCKQSNGSFTVSDLGETLRWLKTQNVSPRRTPKQRLLIGDTCQTLGIELFRGMLTARARTSADLAEVVLRAAQGSLRVADLWFTFRARSFESVTDEVASYLEESRIPFDRSERMPGRSGRVWTIDFHTRTQAKSSYVNVLSTASRSTARKVAEHTLAVWYDLSQARMTSDPIQFVSLFDDTADVWGDEDISLVEDLSEVCFWSRPDELRSKLIA